MVPLYAARVQDLGTDDFVVIKCGACGHTAEIPQSVLPKLGLKPRFTHQIALIAKSAWQRCASD